MKPLYLALSLALMPATTSVIPGAVHAEAQVAALTSAEKTDLLDSISRQLLENYVFPDTAKTMVDSIKRKQAAGDYDAISDPFVLADTLTGDLQAISKDGHLRVLFNPEQIAEMRAQNPDEDTLQSRIDYMRQTNYGFREVKILDGNVGYINLTGFNDAAFGGSTAVAAMNMVANTDALIFDLRQNGGGSPSMIQLISSYLFDAEPVHLNTFYWRPTDSYSQTWTLPHVEGTRRPDIPVYVLTSGGTFSAAEEFSYNLRNLERATLVGETTGGGAHPGGADIATDRFLIWMPRGRAINPITDTNWEGTGVKPHIETKAPEAFDRAYRHALEKLAADKQGADGRMVRWTLGTLKAKAEPAQIDAATLASYVGSYGPRQLFIEDGALHYRREGRSAFRLIPIAEDTFALDGMDDFRLQLVMENGTVVALRGLYQNGRTDQNLKDS